MRKCPSCGGQQADRAKFCEQCGAKLGAVCASCQAEVGDSARFCNQCGTPVSGALDDPAVKETGKTQQHPSWCALSPDLAASWRARLDPECILIRGGLVDALTTESLELKLAGVDTVRLVDEGLVRTAEFHQGRLVACVDLLGVVIRGRWDVVDAFSRDSRATVSLRDLLEDLCAEPGMVFDPEHVHVDEMNLAMASYYKHIRGDIHSARAAFDELRESDEIDRTEYASAALLLFDDTAEARRLLESPGDQHPARVARAWASLFGDHKQARRWIRKMEEAADSSVSWILAAQDWMCTVDDRDAALAAVQRAEELAEESLGLSTLAEFYRIYLDEPDGAREFLERAERLQTDDDGMGFVFIADAWGDLFMDKERVRRVLTMADPALDEVSYSLAAESWFTHVGDRKKAFELLHKAESAASDASDWIELGADWIKTYGELDGGRRCFLEAQNAEGDADDWYTLANHWETLLGDEEKASVLRRRAESEEGIED